MKSYNIFKASTTCEIFAKLKDKNFRIDEILNKPSASVYSAVLPDKNKL